MTFNLRRRHNHVVEFSATRLCVLISASYLRRLFSPNLIGGGDQKSQLLYLILAHDSVGVDTQRDNRTHLLSQMVTLPRRSKPALRRDTQPDKGVRIASTEAKSRYTLIQSNLLQPRRIPSHQHLCRLVHSTLQITGGFQLRSIPFQRCDAHEKMSRRTTAVFEDMIPRTTFFPSGTCFSGSKSPERSSSYSSCAWGEKRFGEFLREIANVRSKRQHPNH